MKKRKSVISPLVDDDDKIIMNGVASIV